MMAVFVLVVLGLVLFTVESDPTRVDDAEAERVGNAKLRRQDKR